MNNHFLPNYDILDRVAFKENTYTMKFKVEDGRYIIIDPITIRAFSTGTITTADVKARFCAKLRQQFSTYVEADFVELDYQIGARFDVNQAKLGFSGFKPYDQQEIHNRSDVNLKYDDPKCVKWRNDLAQLVAVGYESRCPFQATGNKYICKKFPVENQPPGCEIKYVKKMVYSNSK
tara:strand:- start:248 stop:778 length:531 start_codon:yes stop_codon:yes gene_type:complete